jgi:acylphosphatase
MNVNNPAKSEDARLHVWVSGRVQGVGFRAFVLQSAQIMGLTGWVRNVGDDQVEATAEGSREALERFLKAVKTGPRMSLVEEARQEWEQATGEFPGFNVRHCF